MGDLGLFIPLVVAVCVTSGMNIGIVLIAAGVMNIATGYLFNQPIPVQPMKAIAAVAIADGLTSHQIAASGFLMGLILLALAHTHLIKCITERIPLILIRGIQVGVGCKLILLSLDWVLELPFLRSSTAGQLPSLDLGVEQVSSQASLNDANLLDLLNTGLVACFVLVLLLASIKRSFPALLLVFLIGVFYVFAQSSEQALQKEAATNLFNINIILPSFSDFTFAFWYAVLPQVPLTLLNSVIAICALSADYFPKKGIATTKMASSVGWMNVLCAPVGGLPMCHGASGLAAQYQFGARTGGSVIMLGVFKVMLGVFLGTSLLGALSIYPKSILAPLLIVAGIALCKSAWNERRGLNYWVLLSTVVGILLVNTLFGFVLGCIVYWVYEQKKHLQ